MRDHPTQPQPPDSLAQSILAQVGLRRPATLPLDQEEQRTATLHHPAWPMRLAAVQALGAQGEQTPIEPLLDALHDEHPAVRAAAARTLSRQGSRAPIEPLVAALQDVTWQVRTEAALALGKLWQRAPVEPLVATLSDADDSVRAAAAWALGELRARTPVEPLVVALQDRVWSVREAAALALRQLDARMPVAALAAAQQDIDSAVRQAAGVALSTHFIGQTSHTTVPPPAVIVPAPGWRAAMAIVSLLALVPLSLALMLSGGGDQLEVLTSRVIALAIGCATIATVNLIANRY